MTSKMKITVEERLLQFAALLSATLPLLGDRSLLHERADISGSLDTIHYFPPKCELPIGLQHHKALEPWRLKSKESGRSSD